MGNLRLCCRFGCEPVGRTSLRPRYGCHQKMAHIGGVPRTQYCDADLLLAPDLARGRFLQVFSCGFWCPASWPCPVFFQRNGASVALSCAVDPEMMLRCSIFKESIWTRPDSWDRNAIRTLTMCEREPAVWPRRQDAGHATRAWIQGQAGTMQSGTRLHSRCRGS